MDYKLTNQLIAIGVYTAYSIWTILAFLLLIALIKRRWIFLKRLLKYTLNTSVFLIASAFILDLALIVRPTFYETKEKSSIALKVWIREHQLNDIYIALTAIIILLGINLLFHFKVERKENKKDLFVLITFDTIVLFAGIWLTGQSAYFGLLQEINRHFN